MNAKILFVDDDSNILSGLYRTFRKRYEVDVASGGEQGLMALEEHGPYAVVVADMAMPGMNGIEFLRRAQEVAPDAIRVMLTGHLGPALMIEAINRGQVFRFLAKPCETEELSLALDAGIRQYRLVVAEREILETTLARSIEAMTGILSALDPGTFQGAQLLAGRAREVAATLGIAEAWPLTVAALLSPLWTLQSPPAALEKLAAGDPLGPAERERLGAALEKAVALIRPIPRLEGVAAILAHLGTWQDGSGLAPSVAEGDSAPMGARILRALMDFNAIEGRRRSGDVALEELRLQGHRYDPEVLAAVAQTFHLSLHAH
jgi:response regulator RpfG family c-di-GMP phosphodiesterase